ncbi:sensor histidine kinase [Ruminococcus flavefaciens]|uniref:histidine kinase n=1 Tax=Ruminococcus flavefaciens TaxID=1265 RepID=A0A315Y197_RUMFL|nr:HAMP domain-containing sensor histidine kinase [Ruminococcus flavefaciens]PWJ14041.1 signal transduction histidine kinase [Ruminococcus flavefaciens]SSA43675.1 Signal transduction histidine kinase [Ruminococcus flavefaciens]
MSTFRKLAAAVIVLFIAVIAGLNIYLLRSGDSGTYRVEAKRLADRIEETGSTDISGFPHLTGVYSGEQLYRSDEHYLIIEAGGKLYRVEYTTEGRNRTVWAVNCVLAALFLLILILLVYIRRNIIVPFGRLNTVPQELAKGNLAVPIPEEKSRLFGKFTWGVNLLREKIEGDRQKELSMQRDKKLLLLSLSHDIKTPLSAIKLNAKALARGLYKDEEKRRSAAESINSRADEIEHFVSEITKAASEDFMEFEVTQGEVFLSSILRRLSDRYAQQLAVSGTKFTIDRFDDCILSCDPDRLAECLQNLIENAVKYGDGRQIGLSFDKMDGCELITVSNTGCSLEEKELPQIFESFHRGSNAENVQGNGLGLFICKRLMSLMGGEIYADIREERFCVTLVVRLA